MKFSSIIPSGNCFVIGTEKFAWNYDRAIECNGVQNVTAIGVLNRHIHSNFQIILKLLIIRILKKLINDVLLQRVMTYFLKISLICDINHLFHTFCTQCITNTTYVRVGVGRAPYRLSLAGGTII